MNNNEQHGKLGLVFLAHVFLLKLMFCVTDDEESEEEVQVVAPVVKAAVIISKKSKYADEDASDDDVKVSWTEGVLRETRRADDYDY